MNQGATFSLPNQYAASAVVVADGVMALATKYLLTSATAAFTQRDQGKAITVAGAGAAAADLVTRIEEVISATKVRLLDPAQTAVAAANLTYIVGVVRIRNLLRQGDVDGRTYTDALYAHQLQLQVNSLSPGKVYVGGPNVTPTDVGVELIAPGSEDNMTSVTLDHFVCADADASLLNILWTTS